MNLLFLSIFFPLISFSCTVFSNKKFSNYVYNVLGTLPIFFCFICTNYFYFNYFCHGAEHFSKTLWTWIVINKVPINFGIYVDRLSLIMLEVITGVGFLIQFFSIWYMSKKNDLSRFFSYTNLFFTSMILLVLSDNLLLTYLSWELVGFCSYALIGFYYKDLSNIKSSMKAFIITRIGDLFILSAIFILFLNLHTINFFELNYFFHFLKNLYKYPFLEYVSLFILLGALSKSAQFPLQIWLIKAMVGPTPVSALIHSATMITAGVYLIIRMHFLFEMYDSILFLISIFGVLTILISSFSAIFENNIKKILAYSTMSQIGYMFLGLGMKLWNYVIAHLVVHSFFKALLFLSSGALIYSCNNEKNILKMGGLKSSLPFLFFCFLMGIFSLIAFPILTSSFYTKGLIIFETLNKHYYYLFFASILGCFFTAIYSSRMLFLIFFNKVQLKVRFLRNIYYFFPLLILSILSSCIGVIFFRPDLGISIISDCLNLKKVFFEIFLFILAILGIFIAYFFYIRKYQNIQDQYKRKSFFSFFCFLDKNFGLDCLYRFFFINLFTFFKMFFSINFLKKIFNCLNFLLKFLNNFLNFFENGYLRFYILSIFIGTLFIFIYLLI